MLRRLAVLDPVAPRRPTPAAASCLGRVADSDLVSLIVETLPGRPVAVRHYLFSALRQCWQYTVPLVARRLRADAPAPSVPRSGSTSPSRSPRRPCWGPCCGWRRIPMAMCDSPWRVRSSITSTPRRPLRSIRLLVETRTGSACGRKSARALGVLKVTEAIGPLGELLGDRAWWVRFRAALSLAQLGEPGRRMLREARVGGDRYASEMATMISGLSGGGVLELADA